MPQHAYAPGLRVTPWTTLRKDRRLPLAGQVRVKLGDRVRATDIVAHAQLPGDAVSVNVVNQLGISPSELPRFMLKKTGDAVRRDEVLAQTQPFLKFLRTQARSPIDGTVETVSHITGQVILRAPPRPVDLLAYVDGTIVEVFPDEGVTVETTGALVQGILGIGGEVHGEIAIAAKTPDAILQPSDLAETLAGKIVIAGSLVTRPVFDRASQVGIAALVCGGFHDADLRDLLGYDLGVAITGHETIRPTLIITEGFGEIAMAQRTFDLLASHQSHPASANGATQIRAGVLRPEIIIPQPQSTGASPAQPQGNLGLTLGATVRIIRAPAFGRLGSVKSLPPDPQLIESEALVRVVELLLADGQTMIVPRTNVEVIES